VADFYAARSGLIPPLPRPTFSPAFSLEVSKTRRDAWCLFRVHDFAREPRAFELPPPLSAHVSLFAESYRASFH
jgi:hypothetical protein